MEGFDKTMFEIYREGDFNRRFRVVYFTELGNKTRESEINKAMLGDHIYDGFLSGWRKDEAKSKIEDILSRLNEGQEIPAQEISKVLQPYLEENA